MSFEIATASINTTQANINSKLDHFQSDLNLVEASVDHVSSSAPAIVFYQKQIQTWTATMPSQCPTAYNGFFISSQILNIYFCLR